MRLAAGLLMIFAAGGASAHDWYDSDCCSSKDCRPVEDADVLESREGWLTPFGPVSYGDARVRQSLDDRYHVCIASEHTAQRILPPHLRCFYAPPRGM